MHIITRDAPPTPRRQTTLELLDDVRLAIAGFAKDFIPAHHTTELRHRPPMVIFRIPGATSPEAEAALHVMAEAVKAATDRNLPALPLQYLVIGGSEAAGIEITPAAEAIRYPTFHIIHRHDLRDLRYTGQPRS